MCIKELTDIAPTTVTQTVTTTRTPHQGHNVQNQGYAPRSSGTPQDKGYAPRNTPQLQEYPSFNSSQYQGYAPRNNPTSQRQEYDTWNNTASQYQEYAPRNNAQSIRPVNEGNAQGISMSQPYREHLLSGPRSKAYDSPNLQDEDDANLARQNSIPRKQVGTAANVPLSSAQASSSPRAQKGHSRQQSAPKPLPSIPAAADRGYTDRQTESTGQPSSILNRSRPIPTSQAVLRDAQDVVDRAQTNTYDTEVVETVAPGQSHS